MSDSSDPMAEEEKELRKRKEEKEKAWLLHYPWVQFSSVQFSCSVVSDSATP